MTNHPRQQPASHEKLVEVGNNTFRVIDEGPTDAPCVMFSHSIMTHASMWDAQAELLRQDFRVIRYDSRGHGKSTHAGDSYSTDMLANDAISILDALAIEKVHFIGLSLGGIVGFDLALKHPGRLHSLVVCDARADSPEEFARPWDARIEAAQRHGMQELVDATMARWFGMDFLQTAKADEVRSMIRDTSVDGFVATARALQSYDYLDLTRTSQLPIVPVTLITGERDGVMPAVMQSLATQIGHATFTLIPAAGHLPNLENPKAFNDALESHFRSLGVTAAI
jgi:3-oxoadipate enol-lactonase